MAKDWQYRAKHEIRKKVLKEFENRSHEDLVDEILSLRSELEKANKALEEQSQTDSKQPEFEERKYKQEWSNATKIVFLLYKQQKPMTSLELEKEIRKYDTHFKDYNNPTLILSTTLARSSKSGRIKRIKLPGVRTYFFALPQWFTKEGDLKSDFGLELRSFE